ncbi:MAG: hypothetical protein ABFS45_05935 [Pseudomonadota bacterium]
MSNPLDDHLALHTLRKVIAAEDYNRVRLALRRISNPLQLELASIKCLDIILTDHYWLCIDSCMGDQPIMAWTDFQSTDRSAIHTPVSCMLRLYHVHAGLVMGEVMEDLGYELQRRLDAL